MLQSWTEHHERMTSNVDIINVNITWQIEGFWLKEPQFIDLQNMLKIFVQPTNRNSDQSNLFPQDKRPLSRHSPSEPKFGIKPSSGNVSLQDRELQPLFAQPCS